MRRNLLARLVVTVGAGALAYGAWTFLMLDDSVVRGLVVVMVVPIWGLCLATVAWAWKRHPF